MSIMSPCNLWYTHKGQVGIISPGLFHLRPLYKGSGQTSVIFLSSLLAPPCPLDFIVLPTRNTAY